MSSIPELPLAARDPRDFERVPRGRTEDVLLRSGDHVLMRPITPDDKAALAAGFARLGERSRYQRFLAPISRLSSRELKYLTEIDHHDHEALIALAAGEPGVVGVARYVRDDSTPAEAEVAVAVVDDWQARGVATALLRRLACRAREEGITTFAASCLASNHEILALLDELGEGSTASAPADGTVDVRVRLPADAHEASPLRGALRAAAAGRLSRRADRGPGARTAPR